MHWIALQPRPEAPGTEAGVDPHSAWAWWALQFTPLVARVEAALLLEVSASVRLFGGGDALLAQLLKPNWPLAPVEYAQGATSLVAFGRLQLASTSDSDHAAIAATSTLPADALPLHTLVAARAHLHTLARLGLTTWGQLRALPRGGVVRRFGAGLVDALDCAYGQQAEVYPWLTLPDVFDAPLELLSSVENASALLFGARRLLAQLQLWLRARQRGVLALELLWELDARRSNAAHIDAHHSGGARGRLVLRTAQPTQDMQHLARLLGEQLAQVTLPAPVLHLRLRSLQTQPLAGESISLLPEDVRHGDSLHQLLERLSARLGPQLVRSISLHADHRPERMQCWQAAADVPSTGAKKGLPLATKSVAITSYSTRVKGLNGLDGLPPMALYPSWLLATPLRLTVHQGLPQHEGGPLTLLAGPQRLEAGWLDGDAHCALRDYYVARSAVAGLVWLYCERLSGQACWYLHGLYA
ncbi:DNA polymerase Y family protein [Rhodoferax sp. AJA081-3]|uniref:Y-family DNA polymerase n=1 Tax=Rhodoferax sp. AJA081-3 TaxID=2752316 RepID=UPI001ADF229C|nr:DNA polymerase Y family protein [Rhodoferax sp. AJA081-3]QTN27488.1 DNA polymerase Y family protein [Rhodoferax sp. AJA081-3]